MARQQSAPARRPRVGVDFHVWDGIYQGSRSHLIGIYREAIRQAPDIDFVFLLDKVDALAASDPLFRLPNVRLVRMPKRPGVWRLGVQLPWLQLRERIDLMHLQYRLPLLRVGDYACTVHDLLFETHPQFFSRSFALMSRLTYRIAARHACLVYTVSEYTRGELLRLYGAAAATVRVTYNGVDRQRFHPGNAGGERLAELGLVPQGYLLNVGRLEPRKNHVTLVEAYARLGEQAPPLLIVGQRDFGFDAVFEAIERLGLGRRVRVLESVDDALLPVLMRHARMFVYPALAEGFGMPVAEAMASGVPVVTSNTTSLPEVAGDGALTVAPESVSELHAAMSRLLHEPELARTLVQAGLRRADAFDWAQSAKVLLSGFREHFSKRGLAC